MVREGIVLGHRVSERGIDVDRAKIDVIEQLPSPTKVKGVRSFLGHAGFYRRFIKDFTQIARPLNSLLATDIPFNFDGECLNSFHILKKALVSAPVIQSAQYCVVCSWEVCYLKGDHFCVKVGVSSKHYGQIDLPKGYGLDS